MTPPSDLHSDLQVGINGSVVGPLNSLFYSQGPQEKPYVLLSPDLGLDTGGGVLTYHNLMLCPCECVSFFKLCFFPVVKNMNEREGERTERKGGREVKEKEGIQASEDALAQVLGEEAHPAAPPLPVLEVSVPPLTQHLSQQVNLGHILLKSLRSPRLLLVSVGLPGTQPWFWAGQKALCRGQGIGASVGFVLCLQRWEDWGTQCP